MRGDVYGNLTVHEFNQSPKAIQKAYTKFVQKIQSDEKDCEVTKRYFNGCFGAALLPGNKIMLVQNHITGFLLTLATGSFSDEKEDFGVIFGAYEHPKRPFPDYIDPKTMFNINDIYSATSIISDKSVKNYSRFCLIIHSRCGTGTYDEEPDPRLLIGKVNLEKKICCFVDFRLENKFGMMVGFEGMQKTTFGMLDYKVPELLYFEKEFVFIKTVTIKGESFQNFSKESAVQEITKWRVNEENGKLDFVCTLNSPSDNKWMGNAFIHYDGSKIFAMTHDGKWFKGTLDAETDTKISWDVLHHRSVFAPGCRLKNFNW